MLWHRSDPVGICIFAAPAASLALRTQYFGISHPRSRLALSALNDQLWLLQRVVLHPTWRGAGIASLFIRRACELCPVPWIETLSAMGRIHPVFERAGFVRVGVIPRRRGQAYARHLSAESQAKSRFSEPAYFVRDNRATCPVLGR